MILLPPRATRTHPLCPSTPLCRSRWTVIYRSAGDVTSAVDRADGGRLAALVVGGMELLAQRPTTAPIDPLSWGCFPMVPFAGRLRGGRLSWHGRLHELERNHAGHSMHGTRLDRKTTRLNSSH